MRAELDLDVGCVERDDELPDLVARSLGFPEFYGRNWDAFWDCVTSPDLSDMASVLRIPSWATLNARLPRAGRSALYGADRARRMSRVMAVECAQSRHESWPHSEHAFPARPATPTSPSWTSTRRGVSDPLHPGVG
jgi:hypothetical protein